MSDLRNDKSKIGKSLGKKTDIVGKRDGYSKCE